MKEKDTTLLGLNAEDLHERLATERELLRQLRFAHTLSPLENPNRIRFTRRRVARILTLLAQKETQAPAPPPAALAQAAVPETKTTA